ncbi:phosphoglycolate phosphatase [Paracoccus onubensis]|nr:phosphoglycolate phosphatase [Paracoccus onubensis]
MTPCPIAFDLDGTLIDSAPDIHACVNTVLREFHVSPLTLDQVRSFIGGGVEVLWQKVTRATNTDPARMPDMVSAFMARYHTATALTRLFPNVKETLEILAGRGHPLGICTNKPLQPTKAILDHFGIRDLFGEIIGGDSLPEKKPDPAPLRAVLAGLGAHPANPQAIYVGDSEFDAHCAAAVPVPFMIFSRGYRQTPIAELPHAAEFDDFTALPALIESAKSVA